MKRSVEKDWGDILKRWDRERKKEEKKLASENITEGKIISYPSGNLLQDVEMAIENIRRYTGGV